MKQGRASRDGRYGGKVEPVPHAYNPGGVAQIGVSQIQHHRRGRTCLSRGGATRDSGLSDQWAWDAPRRYWGRIRLSPRPQHSVLPPASHLLHYFPTACLYAIFRHATMQPETLSGVNERPLPSRDRLNMALAFRRFEGQALKPRRPCLTKNHFRV